MEVHVPKEIYSIKTETDRNIITSSNVFGILFDQLKKNIGHKRIKRFLFHYGWEMGINDGKEALELDLPTDALIKYGPRLHIKNGHIVGIDHECRVVMDDNKNVVSVLGQGVWMDSYEAREYKRVQGLSDSPVCHTLVGYSSGYMSTILNKPLLAKELTCEGRGDKECRWVIKTIEEWKEEGEEDIHLFEDHTIINELSYTYEQLDDEREFLEQIADFQNELTEKIAEGSSLKSVANKAYDRIRIPIIVEGAVTGRVAYSGLTEEKYLLLKDDLETCKEEEKAITENLQGRMKGELIQTGLQKRLVSPVIVQQRLVGHCSFIYDIEEDIDFKKDYLLLERFSNAISLILLNEKTKFESFERMKGNFLERVVDGSLSKTEIVKRGHYTGADLTKPYYTVLVDYRLRNKTIEEEFQFEEYIYGETIHYFKDRGQGILISNYEGKLLVYLALDPFDQQEAMELITNFYNFLNSKQRDQVFIGVSNVTDDIEQIAKSIEEAQVALGADLNNGLTFFNDLGVLGVSINSKNKQAIKLFAKQDLGPIIDEKDSNELLRTLYIYLLNGGNLKKTSTDLALSMGGLRHRISKIEKLLDVDLRDPKDMHRLLFLLQALVSLGELRLD